jgi:hypothetical protein
VSALRWLAHTLKRYLLVVVTVDMIVVIEDPLLACVVVVVRDGIRRLPTS